jgi:hypothetical protein
MNALRCRISPGCPDSQFPNGAWPNRRWQHLRRGRRADTVQAVRFLPQIVSGHNVVPVVIAS